MIENYSYTPKSNSVIDVDIANKKNEIERLNTEIKQLELEKSKLNKDYIGRCFELEDGEYILITGIDFFEKIPFGMRFEFYENSTELYRASTFNEEKVVKEIALKELRGLLDSKVGLKRLLELLDSEV